MTSKDKDHKSESKSANSVNGRGRRLVHEAEGGASGAVAGAVMGAAAGPPGMVAGAIIGGIAGALAAAALDQSSRADAERTRELDDEIGVTGELGAPNPEHPPAQRGVYSQASAGVSGNSAAEPAEGPLQDVDD